MRRKNFLHALAAAAASLATGPVLAQGFPSRPIRFIVSQAPGGPSDTYARLIAKYLSERLGQPVVVDNRPGADGLIGMDAAAKAAPDGHTLVLTASSVSAINPALRPKLAYDPVRDFDPITLIGTIPYILMARPALPASSIKDLVAMARARPGHLTYGYGGSLAHLGTELINSSLGIRVTSVPYKSTSAALNDLLGGQVDLGLFPLGDVLPHFNAGKLKALAVTSRQRDPAFAGVPTMAESGAPNFEFSAWVSIHGPAGLPKETTRRLNTEIAAILATPEVAEQFRAIRFEPQSSSPEQLGALVRSEITRFTRIVKDAGIKQE